MKYYLAVLSSPRGSRRLEPEVQHARLQWLKNLRDLGIVLMSGPSADRTKSVMLLSTENEASARKLLLTDPAVERWSDLVVVEWEIHFGIPNGPTVGRDDGQ